jgi:type IV fimbrial biogenesis protein FimT
MQRPTNRRQRGITLVEQLAAVAITTVVAGSVLPGFDRLSQRKALESAAASVRADLQHARGLAVSLDQRVRLRVQQDARGVCYLVHTGAAGACSCADTNTPVCRDGARTLREERWSASRGLTMSSNTSSMLFDAALGTVTPTGTLEISNRYGESVRLVVNIMGRVRSCAVGGPAAGLPRC